MILFYEARFKLDSFLLLGNKSVNEEDMTGGGSISPAVSAFTPQGTWLDRDERDPRTFFRDLQVWTKMDQDEEPG